MTKREFESRISQLATLACNLRCDLEELSEEARDESLYSDKEDDELMFDSWADMLEDFASSVSQAEEVFFNIKQGKTSIYAPV